MDEKTYGFNREDAGALLNEIAQVDKEFPEIKPRGKGRPCAKEITFIYDIASPTPVTPADFFSGRNPAECGDVEVDYPLGEPCTDGSLVFAIRDEDTGRYNAIATKNAIMGDPVTKDVLITALTASGTCEIGYTKQSAKIITCDESPVTASVSLPTTTMEVVTSVVDSGTDIVVTARDAYVCGFGGEFTTNIETTACSDCSESCVWRWVYANLDWEVFTACPNGCNCGPKPALPNPLPTSALHIIDDISVPCSTPDNTYNESGALSLVIGLGI